MWWVRLSLVLLWRSQTSSAKRPRDVTVSCKNESVNGDGVDWYILYKAPNSEKYIYMDPDTLTTPDRVRVLNNIRDTNGVLANTLRPMLNSDQPDSFGFLSYSDQPPDESVPGQSSGHSKGLVMGDSITQTALWLTHSTPGFPDLASTRPFYPDSGTANGQTFMCVSLPFSELQKVGEHLHNIRAHVFERYIPGDFPENLRHSVLGKKIILKTRRGQELTVRSKTTGETAADGDLYVQLTREFQSEMYAQTWGRQKDRDRSYCENNQYKVMNVEKINIPKLATIPWKPACDHSKWAVTNNNNRPWTCISDMNRSPSQYKRPGGALCIQNQNLHQLFRGFVSDTLACGSNPGTSTACN